MPEYAQRESDIRRTIANFGRRKIVDGCEIEKEIELYLWEEHRRSPDALVWYKKLHWIDFVSTQTIYTYITERWQHLIRFLKYKKGYKIRSKKSYLEPYQNINKKSIHTRAPEIEARNQVWHREVDTIHSSWTERKGWMVTVIERVTRYTELRPVKLRTSNLVTQRIQEILQDHPKEKLLTITSDNWKEFYGSKTIEHLHSLSWYYCDPYCSNQRWSNEQNNWIIRIFYPNGTDFTKITDEEVQKVQDLINKKPRKILWYKTPFELYHWVKY